MWQLLYADQAHYFMDTLTPYTLRITIYLGLSNIYAVVIFVLQKRNIRHNVLKLIQGFTLLT